MSIRSRFADADGRRDAARAGLIVNEYRASTSGLPPPAAGTTIRTGLPAMKAVACAWTTHGNAKNNKAMERRFINLITA